MLLLTVITTMIKLLWTFYLYSILVNIIIAHSNLDLGITRLMVNILDKIFTFIEKNEDKIFFKVKRQSNEIKRDDNSNETKDGSSTCNDDHDEGDQELLRCFTEPEPSHWNALKPVWNPKGDTVSRVRLPARILYLVGCLLRFGILFPVRALLFVSGIFYLIFTLTGISLLPPGKLRDAFYRTNWFIVFRLFQQSYGGLSRFHDVENCSPGGGLCIANHTGPTDIVTFANHSCYGFLGRRKEGFLGFVYKALEEIGSHVWFSLKEKDSVRTKIEETAKNKDAFPMVIFSEGTCVTSDRIMRFKKGAFEVDCTFYPVAIKYDTRYGSPFWNSKTTSFWTYCWTLLTNWAIVSDVYFLPPVVKMSQESSAQFAERVRTLIADKVDLKKVDYDGYAVKYGRS